MRIVHDILTAKLTATAVLVLIIAIAIACAPAGQPAQDTDPNATPEPTATPKIKYLVDSSGHRFAVEVVPEREGPIILQQSLERNALEYQATKDTNLRGGRSIDPEPRPTVLIYVDSAARLVANIPITKLLDLADQPGVLRIEEILEGMPESSNPQ